jgi:TP901 family phage tail tape measure protein
VPEIAKLWATVGADTSDAEAGFARVHGAIGGLAKAATLAFAGAAIAIGAAGVSAVGAATGFERTMSGVKAVAGATSVEMAQLSGLALKLGADTSFSASQAAAGIEELIKGGLSVGDVMGGAAKSTLDLAAAGGIDLPSAATIAANALAQFGLKGRDMAHVADLIAGAANASALDVGQFKFSLQAAGAVAATVGFSFDDLAQAIAVMGKAGVVGSDAGTSLKTMFLNLQPSTKAATAEFKKLGLITASGANAFFDATGKVKSMAAVAGELERATRGMSSAQKLASLEVIFGSDAIRAAAIFAKAGATGFNEMAAAMGKVTAESVGAERLNNLAGDIEQLKGSIETFAITIGTLALPYLRQVAQGATTFVNSLIPLVNVYGPMVIQFGKDMATNLGYLVGVVANLASVVSTGFAAGGVAGALLAWLGEAQRFGGLLVTKTQEWGATLVGWVVPQIPIVLTRLGGLANDVIRWIADQLPRLATALVGWAESFGTWISTAATTQGPTLTAGILSLATHVGTKIVEAGGILGAALLKWGLALVDWVAPQIPPLLVALGALALAAFGWITAQAPLLLAKLGEWGLQLLGWIAPVVRALPDRLGEFKDALWTWITATAPLVWDRLQQWGSAFLAWIYPIIRTIPDRLGELKDAVWSWITATAPIVWDKLKAWGSAFIEWVAPIVLAIPGKLGELATAVWDWIRTTAPVVWEKVKEWGSAFLDWIGPIVLSLPTELGKIKDAAVKWITDTAIPAVKTALDGLEPVVVPAFKRAFENAKLAMQPIWLDITKLLVDFEPTGLRIERLFALIGRAISEVFVPALEAAGRWLAPLLVGGPRGDGMLGAVAFFVNAQTAAWERWIDNVGVAVGWLIKLEAALRPVVNLLNGRTFAEWIGSQANMPPPIHPPARAAERQVFGSDINLPGVVYRNGGYWLPSRDSGGRGMPHHSYGIGVPEIFTPDRPGTFTPLSAFGIGEMVLDVVVNIGEERIYRVLQRVNQFAADKGVR